MPRNGNQSPDRRNTETIPNRGKSNYFHRRPDRRYPATVKNLIRNHENDLFRRQIPFPIAIAIILCVSGTTALFTLAWKDVYYQYELRVPLENGDTINLSYGPHAAL